MYYFVFESEIGEYVVYLQQDVFKTKSHIILSTLKSDTVVSHYTFVKGKGEWKG